MSTLQEVRVTKCKIAVNNFKEIKGKTILVQTNTKFEL